MDSNKDNINIEQLFRDDLHQYLLSIGMVDERLRNFGRRSARAICPTA